MDWLAMTTQRTMNAPSSYEIRVTGHLSVNWAAWFEGLSMRHEPEGETVLSGTLDQAALHGVLIRIRDLGLQLVSVNRIGPMDGRHQCAPSSDA
jgi:hypothetical protein